MQEAPPSPQPAPAAEAPAPDPQAVLARAGEVVAELLKRLAFDARITPSSESDEIRFRILVEEPARLIGRRGATINDLQFLVNRILQRSFKGVPRVYLDVDAPEEPPAPRLNARLQALVEQVRRWGNPVDLGLLNEAERQEVIDAFARDREIEVVPVTPAPSASGLQPMRLQVRGGR